MQVAAMAAVLILLAGGDARAGSLGGFGRPLGGGGGSGLTACRLADYAVNPGQCHEPDVTDRLVTPYALWGSAIEESGCASAEQAALTTKLESAAGLFNVGLLQTRRGVGWQLYAQQGVNCAQALADWDRFADKQRNLFVSRWQDEVRTTLAKCAQRIEGPRPAPKRKPSSAATRRAPMCLVRAEGRRAGGGCDLVPESRETAKPVSVDTLIHANMQACPQAAQERTRAFVGSFMLNYRLEYTFRWFGVNQFLEAQAGGLCGGTLAAYREQDEAMINVFTSAWLSTTAGTGAACQGSGVR